MIAHAQAPAPAQGLQTYYKISFPNAAAHLMEVEMRIPSPAPTEVIAMANWTPGSYMIRDYAKNIETLGASIGGQPVPTQRLTKSQWQVETGGKELTIRYRIYLNELSVRNGQVDASHAFFTPASALCYVPARIAGQHQVQVLPQAAWGTTSVALPTTAPNTYTARNFDELADSPFEIGTHQEQTFTEGSTRYRIANYNAPRPLTPAELDQMRRVVAQANAVFNGDVPVSEYLFITHLMPQGGGGLEHMASTVLQAPTTFMDDEQARLNYLSLVAHEYFHLWNVKRIKPYKLGPFDYQQENYTAMLWFAEGFTAYYDDLIVARSGLITPERYLQILSSNLSAVTNTPANAVQSLQDASLEAWIKYYKPTENSVNQNVSYYTQGAAFAFALEMKLREATKGRTGLDEVMRNLWAKAKADPAFYVTPQTLAQAAQETAATDVSAFITDYTAHARIPDFKALSAANGLDLTAQPVEAETAYLGAQLTRQGDRVVVGAIRRNGPAEQAGLSYGDAVVSIDGSYLTDPTKLKKADYPVGKKVTIAVTRLGHQLALPLVVGESTLITFTASIRKKNQLKGWITK